MMRDSTILRKLHADQPVLMMHPNIGLSHQPVEVAGMLGYDAVWLDMEHRSYTERDLEHMVLAARAANIDSLVRIRKSGYTSYFRPLEMGATGLIVPHVKSPEEARFVVDNTRFPPRGRRGFDGAGVDAEYGLTDAMSYLRTIDEKVVLVIQIEDPEAIEHIDAIAAIDGIDVLFLGPADMSISLGIPFQFDHPRILEIKSRIAKAARDHGKWWGVPVGSVEHARQEMERGARLLGTGAAEWILYFAMKRHIEEFRTGLGIA